MGSLIFVTCPQIVGTWVQQKIMKLVNNICQSSAKSICYFSVCHWVISQGSTHNNRGARPRCGASPPARAPVVVCWALADYSMANGKIAYTLGRGQAYIFDMSSTSGYMGEKYFQEFGPIFLACHAILACHVLNAACHGVSISIVSIISVSCRVRILRVSMFMPCHGHPANLTFTELLMNI